MTGEAPVVIVGAGPAGASAAKVLVEAGLRPVVIDEGLQAGGQIFRRPQSPLWRPSKDLYGFDARRAERFRAEFTALEAAIDYQPETLVWGAGHGELHLLHRRQVARQPWSRLIVATGAMDRIVPVKGWTAPGVFSLGGAQIALKAEATMIGRQVVFAGTGPLLYLVAYQYAKAGAKVEAVLETGNPFEKLSLLPGLMSGRSAFAKGLYYIAWLQTAGVPIRTSALPLEVRRSDGGRVSGVSYRHRGAKQFVSCDAVAIGYGLKAETQLADLLGLEFDFDVQQRQWLPRADRDGRSSLGNVYLAGDGLSVRGSEVGASSGRLAALALLKDSGRAAPVDAGPDHRVIARSARFRGALDCAFPFPSQAAASLPDDTMVCRCEGLTAGDIRQAVTSSQEGDINRIKAFCRVGMGRCQGRLCGPAAAEIIAATAVIDITAVGRLRGQAPVKPVALSSLAGVQP